MTQYSTPYMATTNCNKSIIGCCCTCLHIYITENDIQFKSESAHVQHYLRFIHYLYNIECKLTIDCKNSNKYFIALNDHCTYLYNVKYFHIIEPINPMPQMVIEPKHSTSNTNLLLAYITILKSDNLEYTIITLTSIIHKLKENIETLNQKYIQITNNISTILIDMNILNENIINMQSCHDDE